MSTYTPIATQTLGSAASSVIFSSIPQGYTDLVLVMSTTISSGSANLRFRLNSDTGNNYSVTWLYQQSNTTYSNRSSNISAGYCDYNNANVSEISNQLLNFINYSNSFTFKTVLGRANRASVGADALVNLWRNTSAITSIQIFPESSLNFSSGSTFTLYGIAVGNSSAKADGGSSVTTDGTYWYHTYRSSGAFIPRQALTVDYLVVAGGGGGGGRGGGGGGAGGMRSTVTATGGSGSLESALSLSADTSYTVAVGAGGAGGNNMVPEPTTQGRIGSNSIFGSVTSNGGGSGGGTNGENGGAGGSGGGGGAANGTGGSASPSGQGFSGGTASNNNRGGGGGGASAAGASGTSSGNGGAGRATSISGSSVTYAGGGGGGSWDAVSSGTGGSGGGGNGGAVSTNGSNATAFTGGGGGGGGHNGTSGASNFGGAGGAGIVIIRYAV
jgi:hypothetical protein